MSSSRCVNSGEEETSRTFALEGSPSGCRGEDGSRASTDVGEGAGRHQISRRRGRRRGCRRAGAREGSRAAGCEVEFATPPDLKSRSPSRRKRWPTHQRRRSRGRCIGRRGGRRGLGRRRYSQQLLVGGRGARHAAGEDHHHHLDRARTCHYGFRHLSSPRHCSSPRGKGRAEGEEGDDEASAEDGRRRGAKGERGGRGGSDVGWREGGGTDGEEGRGGGA